MRKLLILLLFIMVTNTPAYDLTFDNIKAEVYFSPNGGCEDTIIRYVNGAQKQILMQAYSFTNANIAKALRRASDRNVEVVVIADKSQRQEKYTAINSLLSSGVMVYIDTGHRIAHNKVLVIDGRTVITGSYNFSKSAESDNAENLIIINDRRLAMLYSENFVAHLKHSVVYKP